MSQSCSCEGAGCAGCMAAELSQSAIPHAPPLTIGADDLPGVAKVAEECGEFVQVVGKLLATDGAAKHWDGTDLHVRLVEEAGDLIAAVRYFAEANDIEALVNERAGTKLDLFRRWHREAQG